MTAHQQLEIVARDVGRYLQDRVDGVPVKGMYEALQLGRRVADALRVCEQERRAPKGRRDTKQGLPVEDDAP